MLQRTVLTILAAMSLQAFAAKGDFDFLPQGTGPQKEFQNLMDGGNYRHALLVWESSQAGSTFAQSANGLATWSYLLYQNGMPFTGLQTVMAAPPAKLDSRFLKLWTVELHKSVYIQKGWIPTMGGWKSIVNNESVLLKLTKRHDVELAFARVAKLHDDNERARLLWQIATRAPLINEIDASLQALKLIRESKQTILGLDQLNMTQGRVLYQKGELEAALSFYQLIPKSSSLWVEGVEERAWTHLRQEDYDHALGDITTALSPVLSALAGPETFFLANLISYKVCDYSRIFNTSETFKKRHHDRLQQIQALADTGVNVSINQVFAQFEMKGVSQESAGPLVNFMPRELYRDTPFLRLMESHRALLSEGKVASELLEDSKTLGGSQGLERAIRDSQNQSERLKQQAFQRARVLAQVDLKEYRMVLNKMHIIEGEVIERLHMDENLKGQRSKLTKNDDSAKGDVLVFPYTKEVWMDELDNYKARVKDCPTLKGASL